MCVHAQSLDRAQLFVAPWTVTHQTLPSMDFSRQEYWSGLLFVLPEDIPDPGTEPEAPALAEGFLPLAPLGKRNLTVKC